ncbi:MAG: UDP-3-O-[Rickettsiales bacterium]|nr:UDP-3-O-[3-hydroxymyristoyl] N-acetylglucosamine deacetylase [Rickettsiales bacterium]
MKRKTIKNEVHFSGIGLHSGEKVNIILKPNHNHDGIVFIKNNNIIPARYNNVIDTRLGTTIGNGTEKILTIEHLMAAIWCCNIDDLIIEMDNQEVPILDGSAINFVDEIKKAGVATLNENRKYLKVLKEIEVVEEDKHIKLLPSNEFNIDITVEFNYGNIGKQHFNFNGNKDIFIEEIANCRTFCNESEINYMRSVGLAKGGSLDNAMVFNNDGIINDSGLRYKDEVVKHKLLDCVGDLFTSGYNVLASVISHKGGHTLNNKILQKLFENKSNFELVE